MIILNEEVVAREYVENPTMNNNNPIDTLTLVARYYLGEGYSNKIVHQLLGTYILRCDSLASIPRWDNAIESAIRRASKRPLLKIDSIPISKTELEKVTSTGSRLASRLVFTLLCLSKYWNIVRDSNTYWVNTPDREIMRLANINISIKYESDIYRKLKELGLIEYSRKINVTHVRVTFADEETPVLQIEDFRNLGFQYQRYMGEPYKECALCGELFPVPKRQKGMPRKYCKSCAVIPTQTRYKLMKSR